MNTARLVNGFSGGIIPGGGRWSTWSTPTRVYTRPAQTRAPAASVTAVPARVRQQQAITRAATGRARIEAARKLAQLREQAFRAAQAAEKLRKERIAAEGARRLAEARARSDAAMKLARERRAAERAQAEREAARRKAEAAARKPPGKSEGIRKWEAHYNRAGVTMPGSVRETVERRDKSQFFKAVAGRQFFQEKGYRPGVEWMFNAAYGGKTMPYWDAWYDRRMTAQEIGGRVAADFVRALERQEAANVQYTKAVDVWYDAGTPGPRPTATVSQRELPELPARQVRRATMELPELRARAAPGRLVRRMELPPLIFGF